MFFVFFINFFNFDKYCYLFSFSKFKISSLALSKMFSISKIILGLISANDMGDLPACAFLPRPSLTLISLLVMLTLEMAFISSLF